MRNVICLLAFFSFFAITTFAQNPEEESIKKMLYSETQNFFKKDSNAWQHAIVHDAKTTRTSVGNGYFQNQKGWESFGPMMLQAIRENNSLAKYTVIKQYNHIIRVNGNSAYVEFDQEISAPGYDTLYPFFGREYRTLIKENNEWKITSFVSVDTASYTSSEPYYIESNLNAIGYALLGGKKIKDAIEVFKLNVKLFPKSWNVYDSLGEAYADDGDTENAIKNYEQSVSVNPKNDNCIKALEKLKKK